MNKNKNINPKIISIIAFIGAILGFIESIVLTVQEKYSESNVFFVIAFFCLYSMSLFWGKYKAANQV